VSARDGDVDICNVYSVQLSASFKAFSRSGKAMSGCGAGRMSVCLTSHVNWRTYPPLLPNSRFGHRILHKTFPIGTVRARAADEQTPKVSQWQGVLGNVGTVAAYAGLLFYAFKLSPNQTPLRDGYFIEKLVGLGANDGVSHFLPVAKCKVSAQYLVTDRRHREH
jgi:hypothetical protein